MFQVFSFSVSPLSLPSLREIVPVSGCGGISPRRVVRFQRDIFGLMFSYAVFLRHIFLGFAILAQRLRTRQAGLRSRKTGVSRYATAFSAYPFSIPCFARVRFFVCGYNFADLGCCFHSDPPGWWWWWFRSLP